jgi:UDP-glucuronate decarboxylase
MTKLAEKVVALVGSKSKMPHMPLSNDDPRQRQPDIRKAKAVLDWEPKINLETGLAKTIAYFDDLLARSA